MNYVRTVSGLAFPFGVEAAVAAARVRLKDVGEALAKTPRFGGHTPDHFYSVAQHMVQWQREFRSPLSRLYWLLHDAHEAYTGDKTSPFVREVEARAFAPVIAQLKGEVDAAIAMAVDVPWPPPAEISALVAEVDRRAWATEFRDLMADPRYTPGPSDALGVEPFRNPVTRCWPWPEAEQRYLEAFAEARETAEPEIIALKAERSGAA